MKKISKLISLMALSVLALTACNKEKYPEYVPADKPATQEVYFANNLPASYDLNGKTSFAVKVNRVNTGSALTVNITSGADPLFTVPSSVTFAPDATVADLVITFEDGSLVGGTDYKFNFSISDETSIYGNTTYSCTASIPAAWVKWKRGHMTEVWWGEEEDEDMYVQDLGDGLFYCYITDCYDTEGGANPTNVYFYWDKNTDKCSVPMQYMGWDNGGVAVYFSDAEAWFKDYYGGDDFFIQRGYKGAADYAYNTAGDVQPYYDGNGGFYLADYFFYAASSEKKGYGFQFGGDKDEFIAEGFDRKTNYNEAYEYEALWVADVKSEAFDTEWEEQKMRLYYDEDKPIDKDDENKALYYLQDYFDEGYGLAFMAHHPETLAPTGEAVFAVANEQFTGVTLFGQKLYAEVKGGKITWEEGEEYPTFEIKVSMFTEDEEGKKVTSFGSFTETIIPNGELQEWYSIDDISGLQKKYYPGNLTMYADDFFGGGRVAWSFSIEDGGSDADGSWLIFKHFAPYNSSAIPNNQFKALWSSKDGLIYITGTRLGDFVYQGSNYPLYIYPAATKIQQYSETDYLVGGYIYDEENDEDHLVFVNHPDNVKPIDGFFLYVDPLGGLAMYYNLDAVWEYEDESRVDSSKTGWSVWRTSANKLNNGLTKSAERAFGLSIKSEAKPVNVAKTNKVFNHAPVESVKDLSEKIFK